MNSNGNHAVTQVRTPYIGTFNQESSCLNFLMSKDQSGVAERLSAKYGAIGASVFRHEKQVGPLGKDTYTLRDSKETRRPLEENGEPASHRGLS